MKQLKKAMVLILALALVLSIFTACGGSGSKGSKELNITENNLLDLNDYLWDTENAPDLETAVTYECRNYSIIQALMPLFENDSYMAYASAIGTASKTKTQEDLNAAIEARYAMKQETSVADGVWFIWGDYDHMAKTDGSEPSEADQDGASLLGYEYNTVVLKYLVDDQSTCRGNIVACSGGAMKGRSNGTEGYPAAEVFNELGYNYFLIQRRVEPYCDDDIYMDFSRAIRYVRSAIETDGLGGGDMVAGVGWSGGAFTLLGAISYYYGDVQYTVQDSDYEPDSIDAYSADLDVAIPVYGNGLDLEGGNTNLPAFFIIQGAADETVDPTATQAMYDTLISIGATAELDMIEGAGHGFGVGVDAGDDLPDGCFEWPSLADAFMQAQISK